MTVELDKATEAGVLRARLTQQRQDLSRTTEAYRKAVARQDSDSIVRLLRSRSQLMRQILDTQCELLLRLRQVDSPSPLSEPGRPFLQTGAAV